MSANGRSSSRPTKADRFEQMVKQIESLTMAVRISQMMSQKMAQQLDAMNNGISVNTSMLNDFQYRVLATQQLLGVDPAQLQVITDGMKLTDFNAESLRKDQEDKCEVSTKIESDADTVIIKSETPDQVPDRGILRSRIRISEMNQPDLQAKLIGCEVGAKVETDLGGMRHIVEVLGIRRDPPSAQPEAEVISIGEAK